MQIVELSSSIQLSRLRSATCQPIRKQYLLLSGEVASRALNTSIAVCLSSKVSSVKKTKGTFDRWDYFCYLSILDLIRQHITIRPLQNKLQQASQNVVTPLSEIKTHCPLNHSGRCENIKYFFVSMIHL